MANVPTLSPKIKIHHGGSDAFRAACVLADVSPTRRQYSKWGRKRGAAYAARGNR